MDPKIKEAVGHFLSKEPAKAFETLNSVMEQRTLELLQAKMADVGQRMFGENNELCEGTSKEIHINTISHGFHEVYQGHPDHGKYLGTVRNTEDGGKYPFHSMSKKGQGSHPDIHSAAVHLGTLHGVEGRHTVHHNPHKLSEQHHDEKHG